MSKNTPFADIYSAGEFFIAYLNSNFRGKDLKFFTNGVVIGLKPLGFYAFDYEYTTNVIATCGRFSCNIADQSESYIIRKIFCEYADSSGNIQSICLLKISPNEVYSLVSWDTEHINFSICDANGNPDVSIAEPGIKPMQERVYVTLEARRDIND